MYAATDLRLQRPVAVKLLHPRFAENESVARRFVQEARTAAQLRHPNVVDVYDFSVAEDGSFFLVLEYLEGRTLMDLVQQGPVDPFVVVRLIDPVLDALSEAHRKGIVHRDLKPANIFLAQGPGGVVIPKLLDFGIVKILHGMGSFSTGEGTIMGTPYYMAPEQAQANSKVSAAADVWSIGVMLYEALTGTYPLDYPRGASSATVLVHVCTKPAIPIRERDATIAPALAELIDRCLLHDREQRFPDAIALRGALRQIESLRAVEAHETTDVSATSLDDGPTSVSASAETVLPEESAGDAVRLPAVAADAFQIESPPGETPTIALRRPSFPESEGEEAAPPRAPSVPPPAALTPTPSSGPPLWIAALIVVVAVIVAFAILLG